MLFLWQFILHLIEVLIADVLVNLMKYTTSNIDNGTILNSFKPKIGAQIQILICWRHSHENLKSALRARSSPQTYTWWYTEFEKAMFLKLMYLVLQWMISIRIAYELKNLSFKFQLIY